MNDISQPELLNNVVQFPVDHLNFIEPQRVVSERKTPIVDAMERESIDLNAISTFKSTFDWTPIRGLELRAQKNPIRGGIVFKSPFKLVNSHTTCQQCLYAFEVDTYGRGCVHNCVYCYAKDQLTAYGYWNNPFPVPVDLNAIRKTFYTVFETDKPSKWREILSKRTPIRIGSMSDSFMWMDDKYQVTKEFLRILSHYQYPHIVFTRSDLIAKDDYMNLIDPNLASVQFSISSTNDELNRLIEPGAPSAKRRLKALKVLSENGIWTTVRLNPFFPIFPDGYFTDENFNWDGEVPRFDFSSFEMVDEIAESGTKSVLAGIVRLAPSALNAIERAAGFNYKSFFTNGKTKSSKDYHYSDKEIRYYYEQLKSRCIKNALEFTTCYIGNGESHFWKDQDLWSNKRDCCNAKGVIKAFKSDSREIEFASRMKFSSIKHGSPNDAENLHKPLGLNLISPTDLRKEDKPIDL